MLNVSGINTSVRKAGSASVKSSHSMSRTARIIKLPTTTSAGEVTGYNTKLRAICWPSITTVSGTA